MTNIPSTSQANAFTGLWFVFRDDNRKIAAHVSTTGEETIFVNGRTASKKKPIKDTSIHRLTLDGNVYEIVFIATKTSTVNLECSLTKNGVCLESFKACCKDKFSTLHSIMHSPFALILSFLFWLLIRSFHLPLYLLIMMVSCHCVFCYYFYRMKNGFVIHRVNI
jgi:hypothetical protein